MNRSGPSLGTTLRLVLGVRFGLFLRRLGGRGVIGAALGSLVATGIASGLGLGAWWVFARVPAVAANPIWMAFALGLFTFLIGLFWVIWPVIAAQVDEAYEMGRFFRYPVRPTRLYALQTLAGLVEPSVLFFYPILAGALIGLADSLRAPWPAAVGLTICFVFMCVATGRALLNLMLNVMTSRRSGEVLFAGLLIFLGLSALIPPVDASWLFARLGDFGGSPEDLSLLANTAKALGATPPGLLGRGLAAAAAGRAQAAFGAGALMLACAGVAWLFGLWLLKRFYRGGRGLRLFPSLTARRANRVRVRRGWKLPGLSGPVSAVFEREVRTLVGNPKGRMLFAVPFFLLIILKVVGAGQLFAYLWGDVWAAMLWTLLGAYVLSVLGGQLFANGFGYDGQAVRWIYWSPAPARAWLLGRNLAQGLFAGVQFLGLGAVLFALIPGATAELWLLPMSAFPLGLLVLLAVGNLVSIRHARHFHFSLARRDRPAATAFLWILVGLACCSLVVVACLALEAQRPGAGKGAMTMLIPLGVVAYRLLLPRAVRWLATHRETLVDAVTR